MVDLIREWILALAAVVGGGVAFSGLRTWRQQLKGGAEYDLARRALRAVYRVRDEIAYLRSRLISAGEMAAASEAAGLDPNSPMAPGPQELTRFVRSLRWKSLKEALSNLDLEELEAEVLWGVTAKGAFKPLRDCVLELSRREAEHDFRTTDPNHMATDERNRIVELREILYGSGDADDLFARRVQGAVSSAETYLRSKLKL